MSGNYKTADIAKHLQNMIEKESLKLAGKKILLVTDTINTGKGIQPIADALHQTGVEFDIASVAINADKKRDFENKLNTRIFRGQEDAPSIYSKNEISGVAKADYATFAEAYRKNSQQANRARRDAKVLANKLAEKIFPTGLDR